MKGSNHAHERGYNHQGAYSPAQRKKVEARAAQLIAELRELRHARKLTQVRRAKNSGHHHG
jgi:hypothetical protein